LEEDRSFYNIAKNLHAAFLRNDEDQFHKCFYAVKSGECDKIEEMLHEKIER